MMKDLDYLEQYKVVRKWADFPLSRNPFCVPYPLEVGNQVFTSSVLNPAVENSSTATVVDGFFIGGGSQNLGVPQLSKRKQALVASSVNESTKVSPYRSDSYQPVAFASSMVPVGIVQSFISNQDMMRIRAADQILLKEEKVYLETHQDAVTLLPEEVERIPVSKGKPVSIGTKV